LVNNDNLSKKSGIWVLHHFGFLLLSQAFDAGGGDDGFSIISIIVLIT
jgi:hypothetical protein